jgi:glyoxylase-like metal-dependent hydrolase (beta-lactamase superfamily II)
VSPETSMLTSPVPVPLIGVLPVNSYLILGEQPTLIDTGISPGRDDFMSTLRELIDPQDLQWIVLTHADRDHTGALAQVLLEAPNARVVTSFISVGIMGVGTDPIPPERAFLVRDGSTVDIGDRTLVATRPPLFDNPGTLAFFDEKQSMLFSSDCFGAPLETPEAALVDDVDAIPEDELRAAQLLWGSVDSPWVHFLETQRLADAVTRFVDRRPQHVLSTHLPPIHGNLDRHVETLTMLPSSVPYAAPDQAAFEALMAQAMQG